ncbi:unnamed protein product [Sphagnum jensenii]
MINRIWRPQSPVSKLACSENLEPVPHEKYPDNASETSKSFLKLHHYRQYPETGTKKTEKQPPAVQSVAAQRVANRSGERQPQIEVILDAWQKEAKNIFATSMPKCVAFWGWGMKQLGIGSSATDAQSDSRTAKREKNKGTGNLEQASILALARWSTQDRGTAVEFLAHFCVAPDLRKHDSVD